METIFKLLVARLILKASDLFKQMEQKPMMNDNYLMSVVYINFEKLKPKKRLDTNIFIQIMLLYIMGWLQEYLDEIKDENEKNQTLFFLLCQFYLYLVGSQINIKNGAHFKLLQKDVTNLISDGSIADKKRRTLIQMGRWSAACEKGENETDTSLALILNEWMQFKDLK
jgi:hypothetical protein